MTSRFLEEKSLSTKSKTSASTKKVATCKALHQYNSELQVRMNDAASCDCKLFGKRCLCKGLLTAGEHVRGNESQAKQNGCNGYLGGVRDHADANARVNAFWYRGTGREQDEVVACWPRGQSAGRRERMLPGWHCQGSQKHDQEEDTQSDHKGAETLFGWLMIVHTNLSVLGFFQSQPCSI